MSTPPPPSSPPPSSPPFPPIAPLSTTLQYVSTAKTHADAQAHCSSTYGGTLVNSISAEQRATTAAMIPSGVSAVWINLAYDTDLEEWRWPDRKEFLSPPSPPFSPPPSSPPSPPPPPPCPWYNRNYENSFSSAPSGQTAGTTYSYWEQTGGGANDVTFESSGIIQKSRHDGTTGVEDAKCPYGWKCIFCDYVKANTNENTQSFDIKTCNDREFSFMPTNPFGNNAHSYYNQGYFTSKDGYSPPWVDRTYGTTGIFYTNKVNGWVVSRFQSETFRLHSGMKYLEWYHKGVKLGRVSWDSSTSASQGVHNDYNGDVKPPYDANGYPTVEQNYGRYDSDGDGIADAGELDGLYLYDADEVQNCLSTGQGCKDAQKDAQICAGTWQFNSGGFPIYSSNKPQPCLESYPAGTTIPSCTSPTNNTEVTRYDCCRPVDEHFERCDLSAHIGKNVFFRIIDFDRNGWISNQIYGVNFRDSSGNLISCDAS